MIDSVCQAYGCLPTEAEAEIERLPAGKLFDLLAVRSFSKALELVERTPIKDWDKLPKSPMVDYAQDLIALREAGRL